MHERNKQYLQTEQYLPDYHHIHLLLLIIYYKYEYENKVYPNANHFPAQLHHHCWLVR